MKSLLVLFCLIPLLSFGQGGNGINLVNSGQSSYAIIVPNDATASENYAASQLCDYLFKVSGAKLNIVAESAAPKGHNIHVGLDGYVKSNYQQNAIDALHKDGILIKTINGNLIISGGRPRGSLNAVYQFLEDYIGCRWWTPTASNIPHRATITLNNIDVNYTPPFFYRNDFAFNTINKADFSATLHEDGDDQPLTPEQGGNEKILGFVHTFGKIMPLKKYFSTHPEWYSDPANHDLPCTSSSKEPAQEKTQLCLTNNDMYNEFLKNTLQWIKDNPSSTIVSISTNDYEGYCKCDDCEKIVQQEGSPSGLLLRFVNRIAADVAKLYPNIKIETLAYAGSINPPRITKPASNVIIRIAPIKANMGYALSAPQNQETQNVISGWKKISGELLYWGYNTNFTNLMLPHPSFYHTSADFKYLAENNVKGVFVQENKYTNGIGYFLDMQAWVMGHLMWNPDLDQAKLTNEFMSGYYGSGGVYLTKYMNLVDSSFRSQNKNLSTFNTDFSFLTVDVLNQASSLFNNAMQAEKGNSVFYDRIQKEKASLDFTWLFLYQQSRITSMVKRRRFMGPSNYTHNVDSLFDKFNEYGMTNVDRYISNDQYRAKMKGQGSNAKIVGNKILIQQAGFKLYQQGTATQIIQDNDATDNTAVAIQGNVKQWAITASLKNFAAVLNGDNWSVSAYVKVDFNGSPKPNETVTIGVYDNDKKALANQVKVPLSSLTGNKYQKISISSIALTGGQNIFISLAANGSVNQLKVDRIELGPSN